jgi:glycosyltransferase involved in cell wall biosynthesis
MQSLWIALIPVYQPTEQLLLLLRKAKHANFHIVIVDDGSDKKYQEVFQSAIQYGTVLRHTQNCGKGQAIKTGLFFIQNHFPADCVIVTIDADGQHRVEDAIRICRIAQDHPNTLVLGSRKLRKHVPIRSKIGNTVTRFVYRVSTGQKVWDTQTGLRAFSARLLPQFLDIPGERYEYEMNVLLTCSRMRIPILEEEIDTIYIDGNVSSHFETIKDSWRIYKEILKFLAASISSFLVDYSLYSILSFCTSDMGDISSILISNIGARAVSASVNYTINRRLVFNSKANFLRSAVQYAVLAAGILMGNTIVLSFLVDFLGINRYVAKLMTEIFFFLLSWMVQRKVIFIEGKDAKKS